MSSPCPAAWPWVTPNRRPIVRRRRTIAKRGRLVQDGRGKSRGRLFDVTTSDRLIASLRRDGRPIVDLRWLALCIGFPLLYCGFDGFAALIPPLGTRQTAWDLSGGLALALLLWRGPRWAP